MDLNEYHSEILSNQLKEMRIQTQRTAQLLYELNKKTNRKKRVRKSIPKSLKDLLWDTTFGDSVGEGNCYVCNIKINSKRFEAGHIVAEANGGKTILENLRCICSVCNKSMGTDNLEEFKGRYFPKIKVDNEIFEKFEYKKNIEECWLCHQEMINEDIRNKKYFDCKILVHLTCWKEYLEYVIKIKGRKANFMRTTDCPHCLDKKFKIINLFT